MRRGLRAVVELSFKPSNGIVSKSRSDFAANSITAATNNICGGVTNKTIDYFVRQWIRLSTILGQHVYYIIGSQGGV